MADLLPEIRNTTRALIIQDDKILLLKKLGGGRGERYALPGGAQDTGETLSDALNRECEEEIAAPVEVGELLHVVEFYKIKDRQPPVRQHLIEFLFLCRIASDYIPQNGPHPDKHQVDVVWTPINELSRLTLFPDYLTDVVSGLVNESGDVYLGAFNDSTTA